MFGRNNTILSKKNYDHVRTEYGEIIYDFEISNSDDAIPDIWNEYNYEQVPNTKSGKYQHSLLTDDNRRLSMSKNISRNLRDNLHNHKRKRNGSRKFIIKKNLNCFGIFL